MYKSALSRRLDFLRVYMSWRMFFYSHVFMGVEPAMESPVSAPLKTDVSLLVHEQGVSSLSLILKVNRRCQLTPTNKPISALMCTAYLPCAAVPCHLHLKKRDRTWYIYVHLFSSSTGISKPRMYEWRPICRVDLVYCHLHFFFFFFCCF